MAENKLSQELSWRGFVYQTTLKDSSELEKSGINFYLGVDPSAPSMTVGNLSTLMMVRHFINYGHKAYMLVGGATGMIGDPDGKSEERTLKPVEEIERNKQALIEQYKRILLGLDFEIIDNYEWFKDLKFLDFLRQVGKHVPMRQMLSRDFVQARLSKEGKGISYAEFSYAIMQGYDFLTLFNNHNVTMQVCGSDQWGNCIAGVELIRRVTGKQAHIWSHPLVINQSTGVKFGKSEEGAVWLDDKLTSVYKFYQFWLNVEDESVENYLKIYTLISKEDLENLMAEFNQDKSTRSAQKYLAYQVTELVHGTERADTVKRISDILFGGGKYADLNENDFQTLGAELGLFDFKDGVNLVQAIIDSSLASSKSEARRYISSRAMYLNGDQVIEGKDILTTQDSVNGYLILRRGKNTLAVIRLS